MEQYIPKSVVLAEINKRLHQLTDAAFDSMIGRNLIEIRDSIDTLEVKEVDLNKEIDLVEDKYHGFESLSRADITDVAKHFFELGLKAQKGECGMKMYIIQEGYTCEVEDSFGDSRSENQACITAVATSREDVVKALAHSIFYNHEEYYDVSARDYQVHEVDVEVGKICFNNKGDFHGFWLTDEEKERVKAMVRELEEQKGE